MIWTPYLHVTSASWIIVMNAISLYKMSNNVNMLRMKPSSKYVMLVDGEAIAWLNRPAYV